MKRGEGRVLWPAVSDTGKTGRLQDAALTANQLSRAYFAAASRAQNAQDAASATVILAAASVASGAVKGTSDAALANRGLVAVGAQTAASRGVPKATIESILDGAQILNCVGGMAMIFSRQDNLTNDPIAQEITLAVVREVRISAKRGLTRDVANYSDVLSAFEAVLPKDAPGPPVVAMDGLQRRTTTATPSDLLAYLTRLQGCVARKKLTETAKKEAGGAPPNTGGAPAK